MNIYVIIISIVFLIFSKLCISIWVYKDAKSKDLDAVAWMLLVLLFSSILTFLLYILIARKDKTIKCKNCNFYQAKGLSYCGRCGSKIELNSQDDNSLFNNKYLLIIALITALIGITLTSIFFVNEIKNDFFQNTPISIFEYQSKFGNKWVASFHYKNGTKSHNIKLEDNCTIDCNWDISKGKIIATISHNDNIIKEFNSEDNPNLSEVLDLKEYEGDKITITVKSEKASGKFSFIANND